MILHKIILSIYPTFYLFFDYESVGKNVIATEWYTPSFPQLHMWYFQ